MTPPLITEDDALTAYQALQGGSLDAGTTDRAASLLRSYHDQQTLDLGQPVFPSQWEKRQKDQDAFTSLFQKPANVDSFDPATAQLASGASDPDGFRIRRANREFLARRFGLSLDQLDGPNYELYRNGYASKKFDGKPLDDAAFYHRAGQEISEARTRQELASSAAVQGRKSAVLGVPMADALKEWQAANPKADPSTATAFSTAYAGIPEELRTNGGKWLSAITARMGARGEADGSEDDQLEEMRRYLSTAPAVDRRTLLAVMAEAGRGADGKGMWQTIGESGFRTLRSMIVGNENTGAAAQVSALMPSAGAKVWTNIPEIKSPEDARAFFAEQRGFMDGQTVTPAMIERGQREITKGEMEFLQREQRRQLRAVQVGREIEEMGNAVDPLRTGYGWFADQLASGTGSSLAIMGPIAVGGWGAVPIMAIGYAGTESDKLKLQYPGLSEESARNIGLVSGALQAPLDMLEMSFVKNMPSVRAVFDGAASVTVRRMLLSGAGNILLENAVEAAQDMATPMVAALSQDVPGYDWNKELSEWWSERPAVFVGMLPLMLLGSAHATINDYRNAQEMLGQRDALGAIGITEADAAPIIEAAANGETEKAATLFQDAFENRRDKAVAAEYQAKLAEALPAQLQAANMQAQEAKMDGLSVTHEGGKWFVNLEGGRRIETSSGEAASFIHDNLLLTRRAEEAQDLVQVVEDWHKAKGSRFDAKTTITPETALFDGKGIQYTDQRRGVITREIRDAATIEEAAREARDMGAQSGDADVVALVNGSNKVAMLDKVAEGVRGIMQRIELHRSDKPLAWNFLHESLEADLRAGFGTGVFTREGAIEAAKSLAQFIQPESIRDASERKLAENLHSIARGEADETTTRETLVEYAMRDVLGRSRSGKGTAGAFSATLNRAMQSASTKPAAKALGRLAAFMRAVRAWLRSVLGIVREINKARGKEGFQNWEQHMEKLLGFSEQANHERAVADELRAIAEQDGMTYKAPSQAEQDAGMAFSFGGANANLSEDMRIGLETARAMAAAGKTAEEIRAVTGWFPGKYDGKMRFEVPDAGYMVKASVISDLKSGAINGVELGDLIDHEALFKAYPEARSLAVVFADTGEASAQFATLAPGVFAIRLNKDKWTPSSIIHEVQHWIQEKEGFASGGSPELFDSGPMFDKKARDLSSDLSENLIGNISGRPNEIVMAAKYGDEKELNIIAKKYGFRSINEALDYLKRQDEKRTPFGQYRRIAGEIEARDVQARQNYTDEQRKAIAPYSSENIAPEDAIVLFGQGGASFSLSPTANLQAIIDHIEARLDADPERRLMYRQEAKRRLSKMARDWSSDRWTGKGDHIRPLTDKRSAKELNKEQAMREALRRDELVNEGMETLTPETLLAYHAGTTALEDHPLVHAMLNDHGKLMSKTTAAAKGKATNEYDSAPWLPPSWYEAGGGMMPDQMAQALHDDGKLNDASPDTLWRELRSVIESTRANNAKVAEAQAAVKEVEKLAAERAKSEAQTWRDEQDAMQSKDWSPKASMLRDLRALDVALAAMPVEVRDKVGGFVKVASLPTEEARLKEIQRRVDMMSTELEKHLQKETRAAIDKLLDKAEPKVKAGEKPKGSMTAEAAQRVAWIREALDVPASSMDGRRLEIEQEMQEPDADLVELAERSQILELFGGMDEQNAASMEAARAYLEEVVKTGKSRWKMAEEARVTAMRNRGQALRTDTGKAGDSPELQRALAQEKTWWAAAKGWAYGLISFPQLMGKAFGEGSTEGSRVVQMVRDATNKRTDAVIEKRRRWRDAMQAIWSGKKWGDVQEALYELSNPNGKQAISVEYRTRKSQTIKVERDVVERIMNDEAQAKALGFHPAEVLRLTNAWLDPKNDKKKSFALERLTEGDAQTLTLSQMQAVNLTMLARQRDYQETLTYHGYTPAVITDLEAGLTDEAKQIRGWMAGEYTDGYASINEVFQRMFGAPLPQIENYSPGTWEGMAGGATLMPEGGMMGAGGVSIGALKTRRKHTAAPRLDDAMAVYWSHVATTEHFKAFAEPVREMRATIFNPETRASVRSRLGEAGFSAIESWLKVFENDGVKRAAALTDIEKFSSRLQNVVATSALAWNIGTLAKQSLAVLGSAYQMPGTAYARGFARLMSGQLDFMKMLRSPAIQRRVLAGASPELRQVMSGFMAEHPGNLTRTPRRIIMRGMELLGETDAFFTAASASIYHDYVKGEALASGMNDTQAEAEAMRRTEAMIGDTAQPVESMDRSLFEVNNATSPNARWLFMFASEARQKTALYGMALSRVLRRQGTAKDARVLFISHVVAPLILQTITNALQDWRDDDDEEILDMAHWSPARYLRAMAMGPLSGLPLLGTFLDSVTVTAMKALGIGKNVKHFENSTDPIGQTFDYTASGIRRMLDGKNDKEPIEQGVNATKAALNLTAAISALHPAGAAFGWLGAAGNSADQVIDWIDNLLPGEEKRQK